MLQTNKTDTSVTPDTKPSELRSLAEILAEVVRFIRRHLAIIMLTCFVAIGAALLHLRAAVPTYIARAEIVVDTKGGPGDAVSVSTVVGSQIAIITSEGVARAVVGKLGLAEDPEFARQNDGALRGTIKSILQLLGLRKSDAEPSAMQYAVESFGSKLSAKRVGFTYIVAITFESSDPERAAQILNTVAETHIMASIDAKYKTALRSEKWVKDRINLLSSQASAAQNVVADYYKNRSDVADSADTLDAGKSSSQRATRTQSDLRELEVAAESSAKAYDNFLRMVRYMDAMQQQSLPVFEARLLTEASRPLRPSSPRPRMVLGVSMVAGLLLGIAIGVLRDLSGRAMRGREQVWRESRDIPTYHSEQSPEQRRTPHLDEGRKERSKTG